MGFFKWSEATPAVPAPVLTVEEAALRVRTARLLLDGACSRWETAVAEYNEADRAVQVARGDLLVAQQVLVLAAESDPVPQ